MSRRCTVCEHALVGDINTMLSDGRSYAAISRMSGCSEDAIGRHDKHRAQRASVATASPATLEQLRRELDELAGVAGDSLKGQLAIIAAKIKLMEVESRIPREQARNNGSWVEVGSLEWFHSIIAYENSEPFASAYAGAMGEKE